MSTCELSLSFETNAPVKPTNPLYLRKLLVFFLLTISALYCSAQESETEKIISSLIGNPGAELRDTFYFTQSIALRQTVIAAESPKKNVRYLLRFSPRGNLMGMKLLDPDVGLKEGPDMILDFERMQMVTFVRSGETTMAVLSPLSETIAATREGLTLKYGALNASGKSKKIAGHECFRYHFDTPDYSGNFWIAFDLSSKLMRSFEGIGLSIEVSVNGQLKRGVILGIESLDKKRQSQTISMVESLQPADPFSFSTLGYIPLTLPAPVAGNAADDGK